MQVCRALTELVDGIVTDLYEHALRELIEEYGGGTYSGRPVRAVQVGGPLGAYWPSSLFDVPMDYEAFAEKGGMVGHGGIVVFDEVHERNLPADIGLWQHFESVVRDWLGHRLTATTERYVGRYRGDAAVRAPLELFFQGRHLGVPLVAIGGITLENAPQAIAAGADALAVIADVFGAPDPQGRARAHAALFPLRDPTP